MNQSKSGEWNFNDTINFLKTAVILAVSAGITAGIEAAIQYLIKAPTQGMTGYIYPIIVAMLKAVQYYIQGRDTTPHMNGLK